MADAHGCWQMITNTTLPLPADVQVIFTARLDRLTADVKQVVQTAAVLGREFEVGVLAYMLEANTLSVPLAAASDEAIWTALSQFRYIFKHALQQNAAYQMQLQTARCHLHQVAAESMGSVYSTPTLAQQVAIATHYEVACHLGATTLTIVTVAALQAAGEAAQAAGDPTQAASLFSRALSLLPTESSAEQIALLLLRVDAYDLQGARTAQAADLATLHTLVADNPTRLALVIWHRARLTWITGAYSTAITQSQTAVEWAQASGQLTLEAQAHLVWGNSLEQQGLYEAAIVQYNRVHALAKAAKVPAVAAQALADLGWVAYRQGTYAQARAYGERALALAQSSDDLETVANVLNVLGVVANGQGESIATRAYFEQALALHEARGSRHGVSVQLGNLGDMLYRQGLYISAAEYFQKSLLSSEEIESREGLATNLCNLGNVAFAQGAYARSCHAYEQALAVAEEIDSLQLVAYALTGWVLAQAHLTPESTLITSIKRAMMLRQELGAEMLVMESQAVLADLHGQRGELDEAMMQVAPILAYLESGGDFDGTEYGLRNLLVCYAILQASDDPRAEAMLQTAYERLQAHIAKVQDVEIQESLRHNVPWHREIIALYEGTGSP